MIRWTVRKTDDGMDRVRVERRTDVLKAIEFLNSSAPKCRSTRDGKEMMYVSGLGYVGLEVYLYLLEFGE